MDTLFPIADMIEDIKFSKVIWITLYMKITASLIELPNT